MFDNNDIIRQAVEQISSAFELHARFITPDGTVVCRSEELPETCRLINSSPQGKALCDGCFGLGEKRPATQEPTVCCCRGELTHIVVPFRSGGAFRGWLTCGGFRVKDEVGEQAVEARLTELAARLSLSTADLLAARERSALETEAAMKWISRVVQQLSGKNMGNAIHENYSRGFEGMMKDSNLESFWPTVHTLLSIRLPVGSLEVFGVTSGQEVVGLLWPKLEMSEECAAIQSWVRHGLDVPLPLENGEVMAGVRSEGRFLAILRLRPRANTRFDLTHLEIVRNVADLAGDRLRALRLRRSEEVLGRLNTRLAEVKNPKERLRLILEESLRLSTWENGDVSLLNSDHPDWLNVVVRSGRGTEKIPYQVPASKGITGRVLRSKKTAVLPLLAADKDYSGLLTIDKSNLPYQEVRWQTYLAFLEEMKACVKIPLMVGSEVLGILCLHRAEAGLFDLDQVAVVEALAERASVEAACLVVSENLFKLLLPQPAPNWATRFANVPPAEARHQLVKELADKALEVSSAYRVAVCMLNPDKTELSVEEKAGEWPEDFKKFRLSLVGDKGATTHAINTLKHYFLEDTEEPGAFHYKVPPDRTRSAAAVLLRSGTHLLGVVSLSWDTVGMCDKGPDGLMLRERLIRLADEYAAPIEMYDGEEHLRGLEQALKQLKQNGGPSPDYKSFLETVQAMVGASQGMVFIRDRDTGRYDLKAHSAEPSRVGKPGNSYELGEGFTGWVAEHNYSLRLPNKFFTDAELDAIHLGLRPAYKFSDTAIGLQNPPAYMAVPIAVSDEVLGVLRLTGSLRQCFSPDDEQSAMAASSRLAGYLFEIQEGQRNQLLMEFAARIPEMKGLLQLRKKVFEVLRAGLGACDGNIRTLEYIPEGSGESEPVLLRLATSHDDWVVGPLIRRKGEGIAGLLLETDAPEFVDEDIRRPESPCQQMRKDLPPEFFSEVRSLVCIRIETGSRLVGSLYVHKRHPRAFSNLDLAFIRKVARLAGLGLETVDKLESNGLELAVAHSADNFLLGLLRGENTQSLEPKLLRELLGELIEGLGGRLGWVRILNEVENRFDALDSERFRLTAVPAVPAETLLELIGPEGLRVVFVEERDQALLSLLDLWDRQYRGAINKLQWCFLTLSVGGKVLAVYTVLAPRHMAISYKRANKGREFLRVIGDKIVIGRRFEQQQRDVNIGTPLALLGSMIGGLEHRALGPMRKMKSMIEFLKSRSRTPAQIQERDQAMTEEYTKLEKYMAELRTLPGLSRDPFFLEVDVVAVVQSAKEEVVTKMNNVVRVEGQPHTTRPSIRSEYPSGPLRMRGNAKYLQEALQFVIENAWQVAERREGGEVSIRVCRSPSNACQIVIADNGAGMDEQICGRALEMFFSTKPTGVGLGIGLPTAYFIVRSHGGEFQLDSKKGEGTKITITLKLKGDEE